MAIVVLDVWDAQLPAVLVVEAGVQILVIKLVGLDAVELVVQDADRIVKVVVERSALEDVQLVQPPADKDVQLPVEDVLILVQVIVVQ